MNRWRRFKHWLLKPVMTGPQGIAMVMSMVAVVVGTVVVSESSYQANMQRSLAKNSIDATRAYLLAKSGVNIGRLVLELESLMTQFAPQLKNQNIQLYRYADLITGVFNAASIDLPIGQINLGGIEGLGNLKGDFRVDIEPEDTRFNLNALDDLANRPEMIRQMYSMFSPETYREMFERKDIDGYPLTRDFIIANIIDWVDQDTEQTLIDDKGFVKFEKGGDENGYYQSGRYPYRVKNAKFDSVEELRQVRGVDDVFLETFGDEFTVYQGSKVNVNNASSMRLRALICANIADLHDPICDPFRPELINPYLQVILDERSFKAMLMQAPFRTEDEFLKTLQRASLPPYNLPPLNIDQNNLKKSISVRSTVFRVKAEGQVKNLITSIEAVVDSAQANALYYWRVY